MTMPSTVPFDASSDLADLARSLVGRFVWQPPRSGAFLDFESLELRSDGTYVARVEATLVNDAVRSFGARHTLPEEGEWCIYEVAGRARLRIRPTTSAARVYTPALADDVLTLFRRGRTAMLVSSTTASGLVARARDDAAPVFDSR